MADPHEYITDVSYHSNCQSFQGDMYGPYESPNMFPEIVNTRIKIMNNLRGQQTINPTVLVEEMLKTKCPLELHYEVIDIVPLLRNNIAGKRESEALHSIRTALGILEKYGRNLLKPSANRPPKWKIIFFSNGVFKSKVGVVEGAKNILQNLGYSLPITDGLSFPDEVNYPDEDQVLKTVTDLIIAKVEIEKYMNKMHPHPDALYQALHGNSPIQSMNTDIYGPDSRSLGYSSYILGPHSLSTLGSTIYGTAATNLPSQSQPQTQFSRQNVDKKSQGPSPSLASNVAQVANPLQSGNVSQVASVLPQQVSISSVSSAYHSADSDCNLCGEGKAAIYCKDCNNSNCVECDKVWHSHPKRHGHKTEPLRVNIDGDNKILPESSTSDNYSQQIAAKVKRPPSTLMFEKPVPSSNDQVAPKDKTVISPLTQSCEIEKKIPVPAPRQVKAPSEEPTTPASLQAGGSYMQMRSNDDSFLDSSVMSSSSHYTGTSTSSAQTRSPKDTDEIKQKLLTDCILILENVNLIQEKQDLIEDQDCNDYLVLERERDVLMSRHKSIQKRIKALEVCGTDKRANKSKTTTPQQPSPDQKHKLEFPVPESFQPLALDIKKPPIEDILNMTPKILPESEKADPRRLDDGFARLQTESRLSVFPNNQSASYLEENQPSNQLRIPPEIYTPPTVQPVRVPTASVRAKPSERPKPSEQLPKIQETRSTNPFQRHPEEHDGKPAYRDNTSSVITNEIPEQRPLVPSEGVQSAGWECQYCTFWNTDTSSFICVMCSKTTYMNTEASSSGLPKQEGSSTMQTEDMLKRRTRLEDEIKVKGANEEANKTKDTFSQTFPRRSEVTKKQPDEVLHSLGQQMTLTDMRIRTKQEETRWQGQVLVTAIRKAQCKDFDFDTIEMTLGLAKQENIPVNDWLEDNYTDFVETARIMVTNELNVIIPGSTVSDELLMEILHKCDGDIEKAKKKKVPTATLR